MATERERKREVWRTRSHVFLMETCWAGVVNILGIIRRLFEI